MPSNEPRTANVKAALACVAWGALVLLIPAVPMVSLALPVAAADGGGAAASGGEKIFGDQKCATCHDLSSQDVKAKVKEGAPTYGGDLAGVVTEENMDELAGFISQKTMKDGEKHKKKVALDDAEMKALLGWLATQKKP